MVPQAPTTFFSYSRTDSAFALRLAEDLKAAGANVWMDQIDIAPGDEWDSAVEAAVTKNPWMLLILSPSSVKSKNVRNEISFALEENKTIIPVLYQDCVIPLQLHRIQHVDFRSDYAHGLKTLLKVLGVETPVVGVAAVPVGSRPVSPGPAKYDAQSSGKNQQSAERKVPDQEQIGNAMQTQVDEEQKGSAAQVRLEEEERVRQRAATTRVQQETRVEQEEVAGMATAGEARLRKRLLFRGKPISAWIGVVGVLALLLIAWAIRSALTISQVRGENDVAAAKSLYEKGQYSYAVPLLEIAAKSGNAEAQYLLSLHYDVDFPMYTGVAKDPRRAAELCRSAADAGNTDAMVSLGWSYQKGLGVTQDSAQALSLFRKAADAGNAHAMGSVGRMYEFGNGVEKDVHQATSWYRKAAEAGDLLGMIELGNAYENGAGVRQSYQEALNWYHKVAETKELAHSYDLVARSNAMFLLGNLYFSGHGVQKSYGDAVLWYEKAADANYPEGLSSLGVMYENGWGVTRDLERAIDFYRRAAQLQNQDAKDALKRLGKNPQ